jgi:hypothetical protein
MTYLANQNNNTDKPKESKVQSTILEPGSENQESSKTRVSVIELSLPRMGGGKGRSKLATCTDTV